MFSAGVGPRYVRRDGRAPDVYLAGSQSGRVMEDEGFVDDDFIEEMAWEYVGLHGGAGLTLLKQRAQAAAAAGDSLAAETWRAIVEVAERIMSDPDAGNSLSSPTTWAAGGKQR
jgi:hypothetical protein